MKTIFLFYAVIATIYMAISFYSSYKSFQSKYKKNPEMMNVFVILKSMWTPIKGVKVLGVKVFNWFTVSLIGIPLFVIISIFFFPFSFLGMLKRLCISIKNYFQTGKFSFEPEEEEIKFEMENKKPDYRNNSSRIRMRK